MLKRLALAFSLIFAGSAFAQSVEDMSDAEREAFRAEVRAYLLENPEVLMEAIDVLETRQQLAQEQADLELARSYRDALMEDDHSWVGGNPDGDITLVEFVDYRCGFCRRAHPEVAQLIELDGNIRIIVKEFPILGEASVASSRFAIATLQIAGPDAYKLVSDILISLEGEPTDATLRELAVAVGLDGDEIVGHMNSDEVNAVIQANRALAQQLQISGTPTFVLEDRMLRGYLPLPQMQALVAELRG